MDAFVLARLAETLERVWVGAWLQGAWEDCNGRLILKLRQRGRNGLLLLDANRGGAGLGLVPRRPACPVRPTALAAYLRAHGRGTLRAARAIPGQRIAELEIGSPSSTCQVVLEALPRGGRLLVLDASGVARAAAGGGGGRDAVGQPYRRPTVPGDRFLPEAVGKAELTAWLTGGEPLQRQVLGLGAALAREAVHRAEGGNPWAAWRGLLAECAGPGVLWQYPGRLSSARLTHLPDPGVERPDGLASAGEFLLATREAAQRRGAECEAEKAARRFRTRLERRLFKIRADLDNLPDPAESRARADALGAVLWQVGPGQVSVSAPDLRHPTEIHTLSLDPALSPGENLNQAYLQARKRERTRRTLEERLAASEAELAAGPPGEDFGPPSRGRRDLPSGPYRCFRSSDGWSIRVGRNGAENDRLVRESKPWDVWLHVRDAAGAHVVVRKPGRESRVPERTLSEAAGLAAQFSNRSADAAVDVQVAEVARLRKPKGASPGKVLVAGDRTLRVPPGAGNPRLEWIPGHR